MKNLLSPVKWKKKIYFKIISEYYEHKIDKLNRKENLEKSQIREQVM